MYKDHLHIFLVLINYLQLSTLTPILKSYRDCKKPNGNWIEIVKLMANIFSSINRLSFNDHDQFEQKVHNKKMNYIDRRLRAYFHLSAMYVSR